MDSVVYDKLKEKLGAEKITVEGKEVELLAVVADWEEGVTKTRTANKDLTAQREQWEAKEKEYKKQLDTFNTTKSDLEKKIEELAGKSKSKTTEYDELQKSLNALNDQISTLKQETESAKAEAAKNAELAKAANRKASEESLRKEIITELAEHKITGQQADTAVTLILAKGHAKLIEGEDGLHQRSYSTFKDGKELKADTLKVLCKWFADTNPYLVSSSGKPGTGMNHDGPPAGGGNNRNYYSMISRS